MSYYDDYDPADDWDIRQESQFEDAAWEWADEKSEELIGIFIEGGLDQKVLQAHEAAWPLATRELTMAASRLSSSNYDEAVLHVVRAFEGYIRAVLITPVIEQFLEGFVSRRGLAPIDARDLIPQSLRDRAATRYIVFSLVGFTRDVNEAKRIEKIISSALSGSEKGWPLRNRTFHTLFEPGEEETAKLKRTLEVALNASAAPLLNRVAEERLRAQGSQTVNLLDVLARDS